MAEELKDTLNLPVTDFPMRAGLAEREPVRIAHWERQGLYGQIQARAAGKPAFVLHDGHARFPHAVRPGLGLPRPADRA
jgi:isoleucyl-tRNA synthetase